MTRQDYMNALRDALDFIPEETRQAVLDYYAEMLADRMEDGMDEASAVAAMERPEVIAERLKAEGTYAKEEMSKETSEDLTDEAMKFSSLAGSLLQTFEDLEKAGNVEQPVPPEPPVAPEPPVPPTPPESPKHMDVEVNGENISVAVHDLTDSVMDFIKRHTTESTEGDYEKKIFTCPADQVKATRLLCGEMPIRVTACDGSDLTLIYYTCADDPYEMNLDDGVLTLEKVPDVKRHSRFTFSILGGLINMGWNKSAPTVELFIPRDALMDLQAHTTNCSIRVSDCQALCQVDLKTSNSRIEATDLSCINLSCVTGNARLVFKNVRARQQLTGKTTNSRIEATGLRSGGDMQLTTTNTRIEARDLQTFGSLILTTSNSGLLAEDCAAKGELRLNTSNGKLETWRSQGASVNLRTSNGNIRGTIPGRQQDWAIESHTSNGSNSLPKHQPGEKPLTVNTSNGSIDLHFEG